MAQTLSSEPHPERSRLDVLSGWLETRAAAPVAGLLLLVAVLFFGYAVRSYLAADCYQSLHENELNTELVVLFADVDEMLIGLRKGTGYTSKWTNSEFQDSIKKSRHILADGRQSLKDRNPFATYTAIVDLERMVAKAKALATNRVNFILEHQDPSDYDAYEKYRLEGKNLVAIVKELDAILESLDGRTKELPGVCNW